MKTMTPDENQERPSEKQAISLWDSIEIKSVDILTNAAEELKQRIGETHVSGGLQFHKFKIIGDKHFSWFASRNRLNEIAFADNLLARPELKNYRDNLEIKTSRPEIKIISSPTDIYDLPGQLARLLGHGGAYQNNLDTKMAWKVATDFVNGEFQNRFDEILTINIVIDSADWFYNVAWDYSVMLFDKRNSEVVFIDITDTD